MYLTGYISNDLANRGGVSFGLLGAGAQAGATSSISADILVAHYTDNGPTATLGWTQVGGSPADDQGVGIAISGGAGAGRGLYCSPADRHLRRHCAGWH